MPRHIKIGLVVLTIGFAVTLGFFVDVVGRIQSLVVDQETEENPFRPPEQPLYAPTDPAIPAKIFFQTTDGEVLLSAEDQTIFKSAELANQAKQILQKIKDGPTKPGLTNAIPADASVAEVFVSADGVAFVDF
jgi:hypothetical protein